MYDVENNHQYIVEILKKMINFNTGMRIFNAIKISTKRYCFYLTH